LLRANEHNRSGNTLAWSNGELFISRGMPKNIWEKSGQPLFPHNSSHTKPPETEPEAPPEKWAGRFRYLPSEFLKSIVKSNIEVLIGVYKITIIFWC
jgi:hypothetical protein